MLLKLKKLRDLVWQLSKATANIGFMFWFNTLSLQKKRIFHRFFAASLDFEESFY
tara:strand:- start:39 stop:203 length:165 start_codon:yes stop_codon:yes gene_type:complete